MLIAVFPFWIPINSDTDTFKGIHTTMWKGKTRPVFDLLIVSTVIAKDIILATRDYKDFKNIPDLMVEDWMIQLQLIPKAVNIENSKIKKNQILSCMKK